MKNADKLMKSSMPQKMKTGGLPPGKTTKQDSDIKSTGLKCGGTVKKPKGKK